MSSTERKFSFVYSKIVENQNDLVGHIAYSLYKANKIQFIENFKSENNQVLPTEKDLEVFHNASITTIPALRIQAEQILSSFTDLTLDESITELEKTIRSEHDTILKEIIKPIIPPPPKGPWDGFWMAVLVKGTQTIIVAIVLFLIVFGSSAKNDFWGAVRSWIPEPDTIKHSHKNEPPVIKSSLKKESGVDPDSIP